MPGGQTSRACDACRKRKKKCDLAQPTCGRCQVLDIACIGSNTQRWKFQHERVRGSSSTLSQAVVVRHAQEAPIPPHLDDKNSLTACRLISLCQVSDLSYDISIYGDYFRFIPRRLGTNQTLDAVVTAFVSAHPTLYTKETSTEALAAYGTALKSLTKALNDGSQRVSPDLLCSLQMLNVCQGWLSKPGDQYVNYHALMSRLLPDMVAQDWTDPFEYAQLIGTSIVVIITSMYSNKIQLNTQVLDPFLRRFHIPRPHQGQDRQALSSLGLYQFLQFPIWIRSPTEHIEEMRDAYDVVKLDLEMLVVRTTKLKATMAFEGGDTIYGRDTVNKDDVEWRTAALARQPGTKLYRLHAQYQLARTLLLTIAIFLSGILRALGDPFDQDDALAAEATTLTEEVLKLCVEMLPLRPLYSSGLAMTIVVAWGADQSPERRTRLGAMMAEYKLEFFGNEWFGGVTWWETYLSKLKDRSIATRHQEYDELVPGNNVFTQVESEIPVGHCTIL